MEQTAEQERSKLNGGNPLPTTPPFECVGEEWKIIGNSGKDNKCRCVSGGGESKTVMTPQIGQLTVVGGCGGGGGGESNSACLNLKWQILIVQFGE